VADGEGEAATAATTVEEKPAEVEAPAPVAAPAPAPSEAVAAAPAVVKIDTESAVHFSDYDAVFDENKGAPEMRYAPKDEDDIELDDGLLRIDESSAAPVGADDIEDLDAPIPKVAPPVNDAIDDKDIEVLE
jgi:hypothetical protein